MDRDLLIRRVPVNQKSPQKIRLIPILVRRPTSGEVGKLSWPAKGYVEPCYLLIAEPDQVTQPLPSTSQDGAACTSTQFAKTDCVLSCGHAFAHKFGG